MKSHNILIMLGLGLTFFSCKNQELSFKIDSSSLKQHYKTSENLELKILNDQNAKIDSIIYYLNNERIKTISNSDIFKLTLENQKFGKKTIKALIYSDGKAYDAETKIEVVSSIEPKLLEYEIVNIYNHDIGAYTQGLEFYNDILLESTGQYGKSSIRHTDYKTGSVTKKVNLENKYFGEGITVINNQLFQLTWQEKKAFVYDPKTLEKIKEFDYFKNIEGWGLTNNGTHLYFSDGTETIYIVDPVTFKEIDYINVYTAMTKIPGLNEMEWINGKIFANIYTKDAIAIIDPASGSVEGVIDLSALKTKVTQHGELDVLNGIAYNPKTESIFVTGKNWDQMFEIKIKN